MATKAIVFTLMDVARNTCNKYELDATPSLVLMEDDIQQIIYKEEGDELEAKVEAYRICQAVSVLGTPFCRQVC